MTIALILALFTQTDGRSREVPHDERQSVEIRLSVADATRHRACVVTFPEDSIDAIVASWNEGDLSIERRRDSLFLKLLRKAEGDLHVVGASGTLYRLYLKPVESEADGRVGIVKPAEAKRKGVNSLDLARVMRRGEAPDWASVRSSAAVLRRTDRSELTCRYIYETTHYLGYVVDLKNLDSEAIRVDPSRFVARDLILVGSREMSVEPGASTRLYLVFWR